MKLRIFIILQFLILLSCSSGWRDEDYRKLIVGKWHLDSICCADGVKQNLEVFFPYMEYNTRGELRYWGIEDHQKTYKYWIRNSVIYTSGVGTQTDSIVRLNKNNMVFRKKICGKNPNGSDFLQIDTYYCSRIE